MNVSNLETAPRAAENVERAEGCDDLAVRLLKDVAALTVSLPEGRLKNDCELQNLAGVIEAIEGRCKELEPMSLCGGALPWAGPSRPRPTEAELIRNRITKAEHMISEYGKALKAAKAELEELGEDLE